MATRGEPQVSIWDFLNYHEETLAAIRSNIGPVSASYPVVRQPFCPNYDDCLAYVVHRQWQNFCCDTCRFARDPETKQQPIIVVAPPE
jgi:hypothetical protein